MKVACDPRQITVSQTNFSKAIGVTTGRVAQLVKEGVVFRDENDKGGGVLLVKSLQSYISFKGLTPGNEDGELDYMTEKAKHEKVKRELAEHKLSIMEHKAYEAHIVELVLTEMLSNLRTRLLGMPSKLAPIMENKSKEEIYTCLTEEIESKLMELSEYTPELFTGEDIEESTEDEEC